jgi:hypothetical protein
MINTNIKDRFNCEYLIIGSGAGGAVAFKNLVERNKDVILIEEGKDFKNQEIQNSVTETFLHAWRNSGITPVLGSPSFAFGEGKCLGGGTYINGGLIWRTPEKILNKWNEDLKTDRFDLSHFGKYFEEIENNLNVGYLEKEIRESNDSLKLLEIGEKFKIKVARVPKSINSTKEENIHTLGSPGINKNSILNKYIYSSENKSGRIFTNCKAEKLFQKNNEIQYVELLKNKNKIQIKAKKIILACGATQTPFLIKKSFGNNFFRSSVEVHLNLRIGVKFNNEINADNGKMFSRQVQEFLDDGVLIMPTSFNKNSFFSSLAKLSNEDLISVEENIKKYANFVIQIQSENKINLNKIIHNLLLTYKISSNDISKIKKYLIYLCDVFFETGAEEIILPIKKNSIIKKNDDFKKKIDAFIIPKNLEIVAVHGMSSAKMGLKRTISSIFDINGKSFDFKNLYCLDSSLLPSSTIESPQATIMAVSKSVIEQI